MRCSSPVITAAVIYSDISDRYPIILHSEYRTVSKSAKKSEVLRRIFSQESIESFNTDLHQANTWNEVNNNLANSKDTNSAMDAFNHIYGTAFQENFS